MSPELRCKAADDIDRHFFCRMVKHSRMMPVFSEEEVERMCRIPREVYEKIRQGCLDDDIFFAERFDAVGRPGATTDQRLTSALRQIAYEACAHSVTEYVGLREATNSECLRHFCEPI